MNKNKGFNIIEVAISIMIVSIAIMMIIAIYTNIIKVQAKGIGKTVASSIGERIMQEIALKKIKTDTGTTELKNPGKDIVNGNVYYYHYKVNKVNEDTNLYQVDVVVYYEIGDNITTEEEIKNITDVKNSVKFSRLITYSDDD